MPRHARPPVLLSYATFVLIGVTAGATGVLLVAQMADYRVDQATIGIMFFTGSAGFALAGLHSGELIHRFGFRMTSAIGSGGYVVVGLFLATRPPFLALVLVQLIQGYATGLLESVLNAYIASLPDARTLMNRLHAFFGVGALLGPVLAAWIVGLAPWTVVWLVLAVAGVPLLAGFLALYPGQRPAELCARVEAALARAAAHDPFLAEHPPAVRYDGFSCEGSVVDGDAPIVLAVADAFRDVHGGAELERRATTATTDARHFVRRGIPAICFGPRAEDIHGIDERVSMSSLADVASVLARVVLQWCGGAPNRPAGTPDHRRRSMHVSR
jgi:MFS family permease